jgi:hypothetical protein
MIHQIGSQNKTLCGIVIECPIEDADPYDDRTIIDKNGLVVTGFGNRHDFVEPTCIKCSQEKKKLLYYCSVHGYVSGKEVTYDEKCDYCGNSV